jgi:hypothetical protein
MRRVVAAGLLPRLVEAGRYHRVLNLVHLALREVPDADDELGAALERYYLHQLGHHLRALDDLRALAEVLRHHDVPWLLVKGPVLSEVVYERPDLRVYHDLDVVVDHGAFPEAIDALEASGSHLLDRNWELIRRERRAQLHLALRLGTVADVHHHLLNRATVRDSLSVPMEALFERAITVTVGDVPVRTLDPTDTLLHLCVHAGLAGGDRLLWLKDVEQSLRRRPIAWDDVVHRARAWRAAPLVAVVLERARSEIGAEVPPEVPPTLFGSPARAAISARIDRAWPVAHSRGRTTPSVIWAQVIRDTWGATLAAFVARAKRRLEKTAHRDEGGWQDPTDGTGGVDPVTEAAARSTYLREVNDAGENGSGRSEADGGQ